MAWRATRGCKRPFFPMVQMREKTTRVVAVETK